MTTPIMHFEDDRWVDHCLMLIIQREANEVAEKREQELKKALALFPEVDPT